MRVTIRPEALADQQRISELITRAFASAEHSDGNEAEIVDKLRSRGELSVSLVAERKGELIGHVSASPVTMSDGSSGWFGLAPVSVIPEYQRKGVGKKLVQAVLNQLKEQAGCVVLGDPTYYRQFGFANLPALTLPGVPPEYFLVLPITSGVPRATVSYSHAFNVETTSAPLVDNRRGSD